MKKFLLGLLLYLASLVPSHATISCALPFTLTNGTIADANQVMANYNALVTCFTQAASAGANSDITSLNGLTTPITPAQGGTNLFIGTTSTGSANAQALATTTPNTFTLSAGYSVTFLPGFTNTAATTFDVHSTGAVAFRYNGAALTGGELCVGVRTFVMYDGANWVLLKSCKEYGGVGPATSVSIVANTADLATAVGHNASIGAGTINSFGSNASTSYPQYLVTFTGAGTLTYNATSMILPGTANISYAQNDSLVAQYLGGGNWQVSSYNKASGTSPVSPTPLCGATGLVLTSNGTNSNITYAVDSSVLISSGNVPIFTTAFSGTINTSTGTVTSTADGMDGEATPTTAFGHVYLISNGTTSAGLVSTNATTPAMPSGYIYKCRVAAFRFSGASIPLVHKTAGSDTNYFPTAGGNTTTFPALQATGAAFAGALTSLSAPPAGTSITSFVPSTATRVRLIMACTTNCTLALSSSSATNGNVFSATNPSECQVQDTSVTTRICDLPYNSGAVFFQAANAGTWGIAVMGWKDKVNAD